MAAANRSTWIESADPEAAPAVDYRSFTDPGGHDERMLLEGVRLARKIAAEEGSAWPSGGPGGHRTIASRSFRLMPR